MSLTETIRNKLRDKVFASQKMPKPTHYTTEELDKLSDAELIKLTNSMPLSLNSHLNKELKKEQSATKRKGGRNRRGTKRRGYKRYQTTPKGKKKKTLRK